MSEPIYDLEQELYVIYRNSNTDSESTVHTCRVVKLAIYGGRRITTVHSKTFHGELDLPSPSYEVFTDFAQAKLRRLLILEKRYSVCQSLHAKEERETAVRLSEIRREINELEDDSAPEQASH